MTKLKIAVVASSNNRFNASICSEIEKAGHTPIHINLNNAYVDISDSTRGYDALYIKNKNGMQRITRKDIDVIIPRIGNSFQANIKKLKLLTETLGIRSVASPASLLLASDKYLTTQRLSISKIKTPKTMYISSNENVESVIQKIKSFPVVAKFVKGSQGKGVFLVSKDNASDKLKSLLVNKTDLIIQEYIDSGAQDYRVIVINGRVVAVEMRTAAKDTEFRANLSLGGVGKKAILSKPQEEMCIKAAAAIGLEVAGVDLITEKTSGIDYLLEINGNFGTKIIEITGVNIAKELVRFAIFKANSIIAKNESTDTREKGEVESTFSISRFFFGVFALTAGIFLGVKLGNNTKCEQ